MYKHTALQDPRKTAPQPVSNFGIDEMDALLSDTALNISAFAGTQVGTLEPQWVRLIEIATD